MRKQILGLVFMSISFCSFGQIKEKESIDNIFSEWNKKDVPGCALGIIKNGKLIYSRGYGVANMEYDIANSESSVFRIGSTSKQFTAACIVILVEQRKLSLDDNLKSFFPDFPDYAEKITVRHLLNHTSGIRDYLMLSYLKGLKDDDYYEDTEIMDWLTNQTDLNFIPGEEYLYSNSGYWLLGKIVEYVSKKNMADFAYEEIFKPLGMNSTHFHNNHNQIVKNRASGYIPNNEGGFEISMTTLNIIGDGGIFTNINDIKKWDDAYYNSNILSREFWSIMTKPGILNSGEIINYASGLVIDEYKGLKTIRHGGAFVGFRAELLRFPDEHLSIVIFANRGDANPSIKANQVADIMLKGSFVDTSAKIQDGTENKKHYSFIKLSPNELKNYSGNYWNETESYARKIYVKNDTLRYYRNENSESPLMPISANEFKMINVPTNLLVRFDNNEKGSMTVIVNGSKPSIFNKYQPIVYTSENLYNFEGRYYSKELDVFYSLKQEDGSLILYVNNDKKSPLKTIMKNLFSNDDYGIFQFENDKYGKLIGFRLVAGRVKNLKFKKE